MCDTVCGRLNHLTDDLPNEGDVAGKGIKGNALRRLNMVQISRKMVNTTLWRRYIDGGNDFSNTLQSVFEKCFLSDVRPSLWEICAK